MKDFSISSSHASRVFRFVSCFAFIVAIFLYGSAIAYAEDVVWVTGRVFASDNTHPLDNAIVAVYDDKNRVVDYARTDSNGEYTLSIPRGVLHLKRGAGGFFHQVFDDVGRVAAFPLKAGIRVAASASSVTDPVTRVGIGAASSLAQSLVDTMAPGEHKKVQEERSRPGALVLKVTLPDHNDVVSVAHVYWMQEEIYKVGGKEQRALSAWLDPVNLTIAGAEKPSTIVSTYFTFTNVRVEPSIAESGQDATLTVTFASPPEPNAPIVVVARNSRNGYMLELTPVGNGVYRGNFKVDKHFPKNDQIFCVLAYAQQADIQGRSKRVEDAINGAGLWNPGKPYVFDPLLVVSRNRAEAILTVIEPSRKR